MQKSVVKRDALDRGTPKRGSPYRSTIQFVLEPDSLRKRVRVRFLFTGGSAKGLLGTVNEQRQGITMTVVSCLFALRNQVRFVRTWSSPYMTHWGQSLCTCVPGERVHL